MSTGSRPSSSAAVANQRPMVSSTASTRMAWSPKRCRTMVSGRLARPEARDADFLGQLLQTRSKASCSSSPETSTASLTVFPSRSLRVVFTFFLSFFYIRGCTRMRVRGLEPPRQRHMILNHARLPFRHTRRRLEAVERRRLNPRPLRATNPVLYQPRGERRDLNPRPLGPQPSALPTELRSPRLPTDTLPRSHRTPRHATAEGAPGRIRTCGPRIRSPLLYPAELQAHGSDTAAVAGGPAEERATGFEPATFSLEG